MYIQANNQKLNIHENLPEERHFLFNSLLRKFISNGLNINKHDLHSAFTLAEVLITLTIIGVIAALTIPLVISTTQDLEYKTRWKKEYSVLSSAINQLIDDNGGTFKNLCPQNDGSCMTTALKTKLNILSVCSNNSAFACLKRPNFLSGGPESLLTGNLTDTTTNSIINLASGSTLFIRVHSADCSAGGGNSCGWAVIDVNGTKLPNSLGKDMYPISMQADKILPFGARGAYYSGVNDCNALAAGYTCGSIYLYN